MNPFWDTRRDLLQRHVVEGIWMRIWSILRLAVIGRWTSQCFILSRRIWHQFTNVAQPWSVACTKFHPVEVECVANKYWLLPSYLIYPLTIQGNMYIILYILYIINLLSGLTDRGGSNVVLLAVGRASPQANQYRSILSVFSETTNRGGSCVAAIAVGSGYYGVFHSRRKVSIGRPTSIDAVDFSLKVVILYTFVGRCRLSNSRDCCSGRHFLFNMVLEAMGVLSSEQKESCTSRAASLKWS